MPFVDFEDETENSFMTFKLIQSTYLSLFLNIIFILSLKTVKNMTRFRYLLLIMNESIP